MQRVLGLAIATFAFSSISGGPAVAKIGGYSTDHGFDQGRGRGIPVDVPALLTAAKGAPPMICSLAANSIRNWGWGDWDAPATPLSFAKASTPNDFESQQLSASDIQLLFAGLAAEDPCVRELSVRLIGTQKAETVGGELVTRLGSSDAGLRSVAALGLGLVEAQNGVEPLIRALRDASVMSAPFSGLSVDRERPLTQPLIDSSATTPRRCVWPVSSVGAWTIPPARFPRSFACCAKTRLRTSVEWRRGRLAIWRRAMA
jgi:hypothetical protein